jgi:phage terminase small subunit
LKKRESKQKRVGKSRAVGKTRRKSAAAKASEIVAKLDETKPEQNGRIVNISNAPDESQLTAKEARFVEEYLVDLNATQAAIRAGYSDKTARQIGYENLTKPHIIDAIAAAMAARSERTRVTADRVIASIATLAYYDIADLFNEKGAMRPVHELSPSVRDAIAGLEVRELYNDDGKNIGRLSKVKLTDKKAARELLGRHLALFTDKHQHEAGPTLEKILAASYGPIAPKEG